MPECECNCKCKREAFIGITVFENPKAKVKLCAACFLNYCRVILSHVNPAPKSAAGIG
jgi:hypothetical protein